MDERGRTGVSPFEERAKTILARAQEESREILQTGELVELAKIFFLEIYTKDGGRRMLLGWQDALEAADEILGMVRGPQIETILASIRQVQEIRAEDLADVSMFALLVNHQKKQRQALKDWQDRSQ